MWWFFSLGMGKDRCHLTKGRLSAYMDQQLTLQEQREVEEHLGLCQGCRQELGSLQATVSLLRKVPQAVPRRSFAVTEARPLPRWSPFPALRVATAVMAVFLVLVFAEDMAHLFQTVPVVTEEKGALSYEAGPGESSTDDRSKGGENGSQLGPTFGVHGQDSLSAGGESGSSPSPEDESVQGGAAEEDQGTAGTSEEGTLGGGQEAGWIHLLEYGLLGVVVVMGGLTIVTWRRGKKTELA